jgi:hypothetical protein
MARRVKSRSSRKPTKPREPKALTEAEGNQLLADITRMINAWEKHAPDEVFGGITLEEFKKATRPSFEIREEIARHEFELQRLLKLADEEDDSPPPKGH